MGVTNAGQELTGPNYLLFVNEPDAMPIYGWSLLENIREQWWQWLEARQRAGQLNNKAAGIVFVVKGPDGSTMYTDAAGKEWPASTIARQTANGLQQGVSRYLPNKIGTLRAGTAKDLAALSDTSDFKVDYYDLGNVGPAQEAILKDLQYLDALGLRGLYIPERSAIEGTHGTKAEAGVHSEIVDDQCNLDRQCIAVAIQHAVDWTVRLNYGESEVGKHVLSPNPVMDKDLDFLRDCAKLMIQNGLIGQVARFMQMSGFFSRVGWPVNETLEDEIDDPESWEAPTPPAGEGNDDEDDDSSHNGNGNGNGTELSRLSRLLDWG
jgi:hypothetical protein